MQEVSREERRASQLNLMAMLRMKLSIALGYKLTPAETREVLNIVFWEAIIFLCGLPEGKRVVSIPNLGHLEVAMVKGRPVRLWGDVKRPKFRLFLAENLKLAMEKKVGISRKDLPGFDWYQQRGYEQAEVLRKVREARKAEKQNAGNGDGAIPEEKDVK